SGAVTEAHARVGAALPRGQNKQGRLAIRDRARRGLSRVEAAMRRAIAGVRKETPRRRPPLAFRWPGDWRSFGGGTDGVGLRGGRAPGGDAPRGAPALPNGGRYAAGLGDLHRAGRRHVRLRSADPFRQTWAALHPPRPYVHQTVRVFTRPTPRRRGMS